MKRWSRKHHRRIQESCQMDQCEAPTRLKSFITHASRMTQQARKGRGRESWSVGIYRLSRKWEEGAWGNWVRWFERSEVKEQEKLTQTHLNAFSSPYLHQAPRLDRIPSGRTDDERWDEGRWGEQTMSKWDFDMNSYPQTFWWMKSGTRTEDEEGWRDLLSRGSMVLIMGVFNLERWHQGTSLKSEDVIMFLIGDEMKVMDGVCVWKGLRW